MHNFKNKNEIVRDLIDRITEAQPLYDLLEKSGISKITEVNPIKKYQRKGDREGIILIVIVKGDNYPEAIRVLIDLKMANLLLIRSSMPPSGLEMTVIEGSYYMHLARTPTIFKILQQTSL